MTKAVVSAARGKTCVNLMTVVDAFQKFRCETINKVCKRQGRGRSGTGVYDANTYEINSRLVQSEKGGL